MAITQSQSITKRAQVKKQKRKNILIEATHWISEPLLDNPFMYNYVRFFLAGKQIGMKNFIQEQLKKYKTITVADFCCGTSDFAASCPKDAEYTGYDANIAFINFSKKRYSHDKKKKFIKADVIKSNEISKKKFDCVLLISAVHHFSDEELDILLPKIKKITKKALIIADIIPNPPHLIQKFFAKIDRGRYVRPREEKLAILKKYFKVTKTQHIPTRSAVQLGIVCEV